MEEDNIIINADDEMKKSKARDYSDDSSVIIHHETDVGEDSGMALRRHNTSYSS